MAIGQTLSLPLVPIGGVEIACVAAHMRYPDRNDLVLIKLPKCAVVAATFTTNRFCAAPVHVAKQHLELQNIRALMINTGNANAGTGERGMNDCLQSCALAADVLDCAPQQVLPYSTGVIGEYLDMSAFDRGLAKVSDEFAEDKWLDAATGIHTTDTVAKGLTTAVDIAGETIYFTGISKGAGMIMPNMATMLAFSATNANISAQDLQTALNTAVDQSFNSITVDGDTSTNDACTLVATGQSECRISPDSDYWDEFQTALSEHMLALAHAIVRDGEGATKFVEIRVKGASKVEDAKEVAYTVAHSPLVKTALFSSDPNWGRILAAVGRARVNSINTDAINIWINDVQIVAGGAVAESYTECAGQRAMNEQEIVITIDLGAGDQQRSVWTTDLSHEYVSINADYRS